MPASVLAEVRFGAATVFQIVKGNLLEEPVDAIVNAANGALAHGGGVAGIISRAAGPAPPEASHGPARRHGLPPAGALPFKGVIHAVGPRFGEGNEEAKLFQALSSAFAVALEKGWQT